MDNCNEQNSCCCTFPVSRCSACREWLGTPYHHQACVRGVGCDCVGLVRGIYRALYGRDANVAMSYTRDWAEATGEETLIAAARSYLVEVDPKLARPGDILLFRYRARTAAKHAGLLARLPAITDALNARSADELRSATAASRGASFGGLAPQPDLTLIHALEGATVSEVPFNAWWRRRIAAAFAFPGIID